MSVLSKSFYSGHRSTDDESAGESFLVRKNKRRISSPSDFESQFSTTGGPVCYLTPSQIARMTGRFNHSLIAWVAGEKSRRPRYLAGRLHRYLNLTGDLAVTELGLGYFVLRFSKSSDYEEALHELPWPIPNLCISVSPWSPNFKPSEATISSVDVWIRLRELCIEYYDGEVLQRIADTIGGRLKKIDPITERLEKCMYARICVGINLCNPLPSFIHIDKIRQDIEYEGLDSLCTVCRLVTVGDVKHDCLSNPCDSSGFNAHHHRVRSFQAIGSSSKQQLQVPCSEPSAWGSRFQILEKEPLFDFSDWPSLRIGDTSVPELVQKKQQLPGLIAKPFETQKEKCGVSVQTLPNLPKVEVPRSHPVSISSNPGESSMAIKAPVLKQSNLVQSSMALHDHPTSIPSYPEAALSSIQPMALHGHPVSVSSNLEAASVSTKAPEIKRNSLTQSMALHCSPTLTPSYSEAAPRTSVKAPLFKQNSSIQSMALHSRPVSISSNHKAASTSIKAPAELKQNKFTQFMAIAPPVVEDQFRAAKTSPPTMLAVHSNQLQPSSTASVPSLPQSLVSEVNLKFYSVGIQRSTRKKDIINTPFRETSVDNCPIVYEIDPKIKSLAIDLSEVPTMESNHNQYVISFVPTLRSGNERGAGSESLSVSASCYNKMLCWNFRGTAIANLIRALKDLIQVYKPSIVLIFGSKISGAAADQVVQELAFCGLYCRKPDGYEGGVWLLLSRRDLQTEVNSYTSQQVSASVHFHSENKPMLGLLDALYKYRNTTARSPTVETDFPLFFGELNK